MKELRIPIIVLNWNGYDDTVECISSLLMMQGVDFQVFLIDNNSDNSEGQRLRDLYTDNEIVRVVLSKVNMGFTKGNNYAFNELLAEDYTYIALLNNDTVVDPFWLKNAIDSAQRQDADMVSSKMINYYDRSIMDNAGHFMLNTAEILPIGHAQPIEKYNANSINLGACGGAAIYRTKMLREAGIFDEFFDTGYEDAEYGVRINLLGYKSIYEPSAKVYHKVSRSIRKVRNEDYVIKIQRNIFYTYVKLLPLSYILFNLLFILIKYFFLFIGALISFNLRVIRIHYRTLKAFLFKDLKRALAMRNRMKERFDFKGKQSTINLMKFFFWTDLRRFYLLFSGRPDLS